MKAVHKGIILLCGLMLSLSGCSDPNRIIDNSETIVNRNWAYSNLVRNDVKIDDPNLTYSLYLNLRVTSDYKYSNIFILLQTNGPGVKNSVVRYEVKLADPDGRWLGDGSGDMYNYQTVLKTGKIFPAKGTYHFEIEQNMRDNPLRGVSDVGLRVQKGTKD